MWQELSDWEKRNNALVYGVLEPQDVKETLRDYYDFDSDNPDRVCGIDIFTDAEMLMGFKYAYDRVEYQDYEAMIDCVAEWLVDLYKNTRGLNKGQLWNAETKTFESVKDFLAKYKENKNAS